MGIEFEVTFDGEAAGLNTHHLSVGYFAEALDKMLFALRKQFNAELKGTSKGKNAGSVSREAKTLDFWIGKIEPGCVRIQGTLDVDSEPILPGVTHQLESAVQQFFKDIKDFEAGHDVPEWIHSYQRKLPPFLNKQRYVLRIDGREYSTEIGTVEIDRDVTELKPCSLRFVGRVVGVKFLPDSVVLRTEEGKQIVVSATSDQISKSFELRAEAIEAMVLLNPGKLLWITKAKTFIPPSTEQIDSYITQKWTAVIEELGK